MLTLLLTLTAAAFLVRMFVLFHDCVHYSLYKSKNTNTFVGHFLGVLFLHHLQFGVSRTSDTMGHTLISMREVLEIYGL